MTALDWLDFRDVAIATIEVVDDLAFEAVDEGPFVTEPAVAARIDNDRRAERASSVLETADSGASPHGMMDAIDAPWLGVASERTGCLDPFAAVSAPPEDPFTDFVRILERVALSAGGSHAGVALVRSLLGLSRVSAAPAGPEARCLAEAHMVTAGHRGLVRSTQFGAQVHAWQGILRGQSSDFSGCGAMTLDEWAADLVARCLGDPARAGVLRRDLRQSGVAAFGLVSAAA
ncbi:MAG: hypothetical protein ABSC94_26950 [Polyangiaceae bacterium]|jgi:hypothetical protein